MPGPLLEITFGSGVRTLDAGSAALGLFDFVKSSAIAPASSSKRTVSTSPLLTARAASGMSQDGEESPSGRAPAGTFQ